MTTETTTSPMSVAEAEGLLAQAAGLMFDDLKLGRHPLLVDLMPDTTRFLRAWGLRLNQTAWFLREQRLAHVLSEEELLRLAGFEMEIALEYLAR